MSLGAGAPSIFYFLDPKRTANKNIIQSIIRCVQELQKVASVLLSLLILARLDDLELQL